MCRDTYGGSFIDRKPVRTYLVKSFSMVLGKYMSMGSKVRQLDTSHSSSCTGSCIPTCYRSLYPAAHDSMFDDFMGIFGDSRGSLLLSAGTG
jgi:hypothetical protein